MKKGFNLMNKLLIILILFVSLPFPLFAQNQNKAVCENVFVNTESDINTGIFDTLHLTSTSRTKVASGASERFKDLTMSDDLIGQTDKRLRAKGLVVPNGGLCGPTCGVNILHTLFSHAEVPTREFKKQPDHWIHDIVQTTQYYYAKDARYGMTANELPVMLSKVVGKITGNENNLEYKTISIFNRDHIYVDYFSPEPNSLTLATVTTGPKSGHFIIILGFDKKQRKLVYADPNAPDKLFTANWVESGFMGYKTINMAWNGQFDASNGWVKTLTVIKLNDGIKKYSYHELLQKILQTIAEHGLVQSVATS